MTGTVMLLADGFAFLSIAYLRPFILTE